MAPADPADLTSVFPPEIAAVSAAASQRVPGLLRQATGVMVDVIIRPGMALAIACEGIRP